jgi:L-ribulose-5-phosphate 3-epimerase
MTRKSARLRMSEGETLAERCNVLAEAGFDGVDIVTPSDLDVDELRGAASDAGIAVANVLAARSLRWMLADADPEVRRHGREGLELSLRDAAAVGASSVMVPSLLPDGVDATTARANTVDELEHVLPLAEELEVRIAIENCWNGFLLSPDELAAFVDGFESTWIVVHFDTGNAQPLGAPTDWIVVLGDRIHKVDLKDFSSERAAEGGVDHGQAIELGEGDCNWAAVGAALRRIGYDGWMSAEVPGSGRGLLTRSAAIMDEVFA